VAALPDDAARDLMLTAQFHVAYGPGGHLDTNVAMFIGAKHRSDFHPTGYRNGEDVHTQLDHATTIFETTHPGKKKRVPVRQQHRAQKDARGCSSRQRSAQRPLRKAGRQTARHDMGDQWWDHAQPALLVRGGWNADVQNHEREGEPSGYGAVRFGVSAGEGSLKPVSGNKKHVPDVTVVSRKEENTYTSRFPLGDVVSGVGVGFM
jgi:hypothetical protein